MSLINKKSIKNVREPLSLFFKKVTVLVFVTSYGIKFPLIFWSEYLKETPCHFFITFQLFSYTLFYILLAVCDDCNLAACLDLPDVAVYKL